MRYAFSDCVLDTARRELTRGGLPVKLRAKAMLVLAYLIEHADRVVPKEELFEKLWARRVVGDATLNSCLKELRRAVGDSGDGQTIVRTLHGQGYRFVAPLVDESPAPAAPRITPAPAACESEHKQVSVLACAIVDAEGRAAILGAEAMDREMRAFFERARTAIERYGGCINEWRGEGFTALFGAPQALEDHARCAVLAALELLQDAEPPLRLGVQTGEVVVGSLDGTAQPYTAYGRTTLGAARMRDAARPGSVVVSETCYRLVETEVVAQALERDCDDAPDGWAVERLARRRGGVPLRARRTVSRFVGRAQEIAIIRTRLELAKGGAGHAVCISGDPGIGKSRLLDELRREVADDRVRLLGAGCLPYRRATPYFALAQLVREICGIADDTGPALVIAHLDAHARRAGIEADEDRQLLREFLDVGAGARSEFEPGSSCSRVFALANRLLFQASREQPCIVAIEDLHWIDATSGVWLAGLVPQLPSAALLLVVTFRPEYRAEWTSHSSVTRLALPRLNDADSAEVVASVAGRAAHEALRRRIVNNAQGNPFFLEELTWSLLEAGAPETEVPTTIQAVLAARIDQLAPEDKALLQTAAVIDTPVADALLHAASAAPAAVIEAGLRRLEAAELLYPVESAAGIEHHFKHALTQDVAYGSLLSSTRRELHKRIAEIYEQRFENVASTQPELVARHYSEAGVSRKALEYWRLAGQRAAHRSANQEAVMHFEHALAIAAEMPDGAERRRIELDIHLMMGPPLMASRAFSSLDVEAAYGKACALARSLADESSLFVAQWGRWVHLTHRGRLREAGALSDELLALAARLGDPGSALQAHHSAWTTHLWDGDLARCRQHALAGAALYDRRKHHAQTHVYGGHDPGVCALGTCGITTWFLGFPDEALRLAGRGASLAASLGHPYSRLITRLDFMLIGSLRREVDVVRDAAEEAFAISSRLGVPNYLAVAKVYLGWSKAVRGDTASGLALLREGIDGCREVGAERNLASYLLLLADVLHATGRAAEGLAVVEEAGALVERTGEVRWGPEILRVRGELLLLSGAPRAAADALFAQALALATAQGALAFELRAATSLARVRAGRRDEARALLEPVLARFNEGGDTADLCRAGEVLAAL
jgi:DNA-binding winged helix-turn-helix (wHTH) protein